jgi:adenosylhomocysteine nucleosidase
MPRVAIVAALPGELKPLVKGWAHAKEKGVDVWQKDGEGAWIAACGGMGADAATRAFAAIERRGTVDVLISYGWVGALTERTAAGAAAWPSGVVDARTGERFEAEGSMEERWLVTVPYVADGEEKRKLAERYGAGFVDMEAATVARLAAMRGLPFYLCRGVSDGLNDRLPDFNRFRGSRGEFRMARFVAYAAIHPQYWPALVRMGENSKKAAAAMAREVQGFLGKSG